MVLTFQSDVNINLRNCIAYYLCLLFMNEAWLFTSLKTVDEMFVNLLYRYSMPKSVD